MIELVGGGGGGGGAPYVAGGRFEPPTGKLQVRTEGGSR